MSYNLLKGKRGIIFGALNDQSIAWKVAERAVEEGATIWCCTAIPWGTSARHMCKFRHLSEKIAGNMRIRS